MNVINYNEICTKIENVSTLNSEKNIKSGIEMSINNKDIKIESNNPIFY